MKNMATMQAEVPFTPEVDAKVEDAIESFKIDDLVRVRGGMSINYGQPTRRFVSLMDSKDPLPTGTVLKAETQYMLRWEWTGLPDMPAPQRK